MLGSSLALAVAAAMGLAAVPPAAARATTASVEVRAPASPGLVRTAPPASTAAPAATRPPPPEVRRPRRDATRPTDRAHDTLDGTRARALLGAGAGLAVVGALLGVGATLAFAASPCRAAAGEDCQRGARTRASLVVGVPGAVAFIAGVTLLGVGGARLRRIRAAASVSTSGAALRVVGRF